MTFKRHAVVLRHVAFEDLGLLAPVLDRAGWSVSFCEAPVEDLSHRAVADADLLIVLGGPIGAYEIEAYPFLRQEISLIERRLAVGRPMLGICLGSQLMAAALGSRVFPGHVKEIGWGSVRLTAAGEVSCLGALAADGAQVLHWHGDTFDLPDGAVRLASNANYDNQAFAYGKAALALQFHLEADPRQLEEWYVGHAVELAAAGVKVTELRAATRALAEALPATAESVFGRWLREIEG
ncbi:MAG: glutamine amidotransferase [Xanthobacteraceae bacterium]|nr:glutamine amidotransferase [Xanthobacteraceae bacterium]